MVPRTCTYTARECSYAAAAADDDETCEHLHGTWYFTDYIHTYGDQALPTVGKRERNRTFIQEPDE